MEKFFTTIPGIVISLGAILAVIVTGSLYVLGLWKKGKDGADDRLIKILQTTVDELERTVKKQTVDIEMLVKEVGEIRTENKLLKELNTGRDEATKEFYKQAFESMKTVRDTHNTITTLAGEMKINNENSTRLIGLLEKHLDALDHTANK